MSWLAGCVALLAQTAALVTAARGARQRLLPGWSSVSAVLATAVLFVALDVLLAQLVGLVGLFHWATLLVGALAAAALLRPDPLVPSVFTDRDGGTAPGRRVQAALGRTDAWGWARRVAVVTGTTFVVGNWVAHVVAVYRNGSSDGDSMMYHLPFATRFVRSGWVTEVPNIGPHPWVAFYPGNVELLQATVMAPLGHVAMVPLLSVGWLLLGLLAGWCIGARSGHGPLGLLAVAAVFSLPVLAATHAGTARVDVAAAALLLAGVALLLNEPRNLGAVAVTGLALGLAMGAKFVILPTAGLLLIFAGLVLWRRDGLPAAGVWVGAAAAPTGLWLVRNWVVSGSPLPMVDLRVGPVGFAPLSGERMEELENSSIVDQLGTHDGYWGEVVVPAFDGVFGPWPVTLTVLGAGVAGAVLILARLRPVGLAHAAAAAALAGSVIYFFSPNSAPTNFGITHIAPVIVALNTRYLMPSLVILLCLLALGLDEKWRRAGSVLCVGAAAAVVAFTLNNRMDTEWPVRWADLGVTVVLLAGVAAGAGGAVLLVRRGAVPQRTVLAVSAAAVVVALVVGTWLAAENQVLNRYRPTPAAQTELWHAVHDEPAGQTVGVLGEWLQQPFYRDDLANEVQYLGTPADRGVYELPESCGDLAAALGEDSYDLVVVQSGLFGHGDLASREQWLVELPGAEVVAGTEMGTVVRLPEEVDLDCDS